MPTRARSREGKDGRVVVMPVGAVTVESCFYGSVAYEIEELPLLENQLAI
tara:strand:+ start:142 stop:291 length:150 start_codon:yes stop_codon:yes gene_type:complete